MCPGKGVETMDGFTVAMLIALILLAVFEIFSLVDYIRTGHHPYDTGEGGEE
jgi:hypothetical protein